MLMCHGSPRKMNEFLWESTTSTHFLEHLTEDHEADVILATHTGIKWHRRLSGDRHFVNVGVLGRPENDGRTNVWYALVEARPERLGPPHQLDERVERADLVGRALVVRSHASRALNLAGPALPRRKPEDARGAVSSGG